MAARPISRFLAIPRRNYSSRADKNIAFLGLGNMGGFMAANLVKKNFNNIGSHLKVMGAG
ncbi:3-hydroxyisobutyrate dehydrogenase [Danaus plexippus plexippus]|uniref:3-hydroxyisobutyrate dehydrogenase n=1 Tax=Danaus plexippus plexippus TaxID=278856 RepID=A0A212EQ87_DANPL|nr:3-hydroxyisobutyrate dehydrogenase [Danaus plexippus plexippus]